MPFLPPSYRKHKARNCAVVTIAGKDHYLGPHNSAESWERYHRLVAEHLAKRSGAAPSPSPVSTSMTIGELILRYWQFVTAYYVKNGRATSEQDSIRQALRFLRLPYSSLLVGEFTPLKLKSVRQAMIDHKVTRKIRARGTEKKEGLREDKILRHGLARSLINKHIGRIKQMFRWAVENELAPSSVYHGLQAVKGLQHGRTSARETEPVRPVSEPMIQAVLPFASRQVRAMIELQLLTGARPGEVCILRGCDLDMTGNVWVYRPGAHKTEHHGHQREIFIGPKAQAILKPFLRLDTQAYLFSAWDAREERSTARRALRKSKVQPSQLSRRKRSPKRPPRDRYEVASYRRAIAYACLKAFPLPEELAPKKRESQTAWQARLTAEEKLAIANWRKRHTWHPHQLRHNAASNLRKEFGIEVARIILGHQTAFTTEIYAEADRAKAAQVIAKIG